MSRSTTSSKNIFDPMYENHNEPEQVVLVKPRQWELIKKRYRMTKRELEIARLVCLGLNNEQIAGNLCIKHGTVKTHVRNIYRKTWVNNKVSMLLKFLSEVQQLDSIHPASKSNLPDQTP